MWFDFEAVRFLHRLTYCLKSYDRVILQASNMSYWRSGLEDLTGLKGTWRFGVEGLTGLESLAGGLDRIKLEALL